MLRIGAHMSVAGGVSLAVDRAALHGCEALQIFAKNASQWRGAPLVPAEVRRVRRRLDETGISGVVSHASYLINLATTAPVLRQQSIEALGDELDRAQDRGLRRAHGRVHLLVRAVEDVEGVGERELVERAARRIRRLGRQLLRAHGLSRTTRAPGVHIGEGRDAPPSTVRHAPVTQPASEETR